MRAFLIAAAVCGASAAAKGPNVAYFRHHNMDKSSTISISSEASVTLNEWNTAINIFDTVTDVKVQRIDVKGSPSATVSLYSKTSPLYLPEGPLYIFHNATKFDLSDASTGKSTSTAKTDAVTWVSKGSCMTFDVQLNSDGGASFFAVTSGAADFTGKSGNSCEEATVLVGAGIQAGGTSSWGHGWIYNEVKYKLANSASCTNPLGHGTNGYSQTDEPIGPLDAHYHTRGALYYTQYGQSKYNDEAAPNDTIYTGELRFVNAGVYYGPEVMDRSTCFVASVHEADPAALDPVGQDPSSECPFACMNTLGGRTPARCTKASKVIV